MDVTSPNAELARALNRLGPEGSRAYDFLLAASEQLSADGTRAGELASYSLREALIALVSLGGERLPGVGETAREVVRRWSLAEDGRLAWDAVGQAVSELIAALEGPGPNERRLESAVARIARERPTRATADLLEQYMRILDAANAALHAEISADAAGELYERALRVVGALFGPITTRFAAIDELLAVEAPGSAEVERLQGLVGDERHLLYFFEKVEGSPWFRALAETSILKSPADARWAAGPYVERIAEVDPDLVRPWLEVRASERLNTKQARDYLWIAQAVRAGVVQIVLSLARTHLSESGVQFGVERFLRLAPLDEVAGSPGRSLVRLALEALLAEDRGAGDVYLAAEVAGIALRAMRNGDAGAWLQVLVHRLRSVADRESPLRLRVLAALDGLQVGPSSTPLELIAAVVVSSADAARELGVSLDDLLSAATLLPEPLATRFTAYVLRGALPDARGLAEAFILDRVSTSDDPTPEELALLRRLNDEPSAGWEKRLRGALGDAPSSETISAWDSGTEVDAGGRRAHYWLVAMPDPIKSAWAEADAGLQKHLGPATLDGVLMRSVTTAPAFLSSPFTVESLNESEPLAAARLVSGWTPPEEESFVGQSRRGLASALHDAVKAKADAWLAAGPQEIVDALVDPRYVDAYLRGLREAPPTNGGRVGELVETISLLQAQHIRDGAVDADWASALDAAVQLLVALTRSRGLPPDAREQALNVAVTAARARHDSSLVGGDHRLVEQAINRRSTRALEAAFIIGDLGDTMSPELLALIEETLLLGGVDGSHGRAILAPRLARLHHVATEWFDERFELVFGARAVDELGRATLDFYLESGSPYRPFLERLRDEITTAVGRIGDAARIHLLHGLLWELPGYPPREVLDLLLEQGTDQVSEAGHWLGWALAQASDVPLDPAIRFWEAAISRELPAAAYFGWGWWATIDRIDDDQWLGLTEQTLQKGDSNIAEADRVATRAARSPHNPSAPRVVARLLEGNPPTWDLEKIGEAGLQLVKTFTGDTHVWHELQERLLERGFHEAANQTQPATRPA